MDHDRPPLLVVGPVVRPLRGVGVPPDRRVVAVAPADELGAALAARPVQET